MYYILRGALECASIAAVVVVFGAGAGFCWFLCLWVIKLTIKHGE